MSSNLGRLARFYGALGAVALLTVVVPGLLVTVSRRRFGSANPLAGVPAPWSWQAASIREALADPLTDAVVVDVIVRGCLVAAWIAVGVVAITTAAEAAHLVRHRGLPMPHVRGVGWAQPIARVVAAGLLALVPLATPKATLVAAGSLDRTGPPHQAPQATLVQSAGGSDGPAKLGPPIHTDHPAQAAIAERPVTAPQLHVVQRGESIYAIAERLAAKVPMSTAEVADALLDANLGNTMPGGQRFTNPAYIEVGWELVVPVAVLPSRADPGVPRIERIDGPTAPADVVTGNLGGTHVVVVGDTLSTIAAERLGSADRWPVIFEANRGEPMSDGRSLTDPNLILPGWVLTVPGAAAPEHAELPEPAHQPEPSALPRTDDPIPEPAAPTPVDTSAPARADIGPTDREGGTTGTIPDEPTIHVAPGTSGTPAHRADAPGPNRSARPEFDVTPAAPTTTTTTTADPVDASSADPDTARLDESSARPPSPVGIEHAAVLAAGVLGLVELRRRLRMRRAAPRSRMPATRPDLVATERRLRALDAGERATRLDVALRAAAVSLVDGDATIAVAFAAPEGEIELHLTAAADIASPWCIVSSDRRSWRLPAAVPIERLAESARQVAAPCIALVQVGVADGRDVYVDLEACGTLAIDAPPTDADAVVTALAAGLGSSPYAEAAHIVTVSLTTDALLGHRNTHQASTVADAVDLAERLTGPTVAAERSRFAMRALRTGGELWEPTVIVLTAADRQQLGAATSVPSGAGRGLALVASVDAHMLRSAPARLVADDTHWSLAAFDRTTTVTPVGLTPAGLDDVVEMLDAANLPLIEPEPPNPEDASTGPTASDTEVAFEPTDHEIVVRLMGGVEVVSRDGTPGSFERSKTIELIAWLATHRDRATRTAARTALWELDVRDATFANVVSEARRGLGRLVPPPDGAEWLGRTLTEQLPLHDGVVTDAALMIERLDAARDVPPDRAVQLLRPAAEMIRDLPLAGTSYLWADADGITSNLVLLATGVATELAEHALSLGDIDLVFWATGQGLKVLPGHETLIGLRMRAHARAGDLAGVRQEWAAYERVIVGDAWSDGEPAQCLVELRRELLSPSR